MRYKNDIFITNNFAKLFFIFMQNEIIFHIKNSLRDRSRVRKAISTNFANVPRYRNYYFANDITISSQKPFLIYKRCLLPEE